MVITKFMMKPIVIAKQKVCCLITNSVSLLESRIYGDHT